MGEIDQGVYFIPALNAALCSLLSSYTLISILDHERWMKVSDPIGGGGWRWGWGVGGRLLVTTNQQRLSTFRHPLSPDCK